MKSLGKYGILVAGLLLCIGQQPASATDFVLNQLGATCTQEGDFAFAQFVTEPQNHQIVLDLEGSGKAIASGAVTFSHTIFQSIQFRFTGDCEYNFIPASLIARISFLPPGTSTVLDHGYDCARNVYRTFPNGRTEVRITGASVCDCDDHIPPGSALLGISLQLTCDDTDTSNRHSDQIYSLVVNGHPIPFDLRAQSAECED